MKKLLCMVLVAMMLAACGGDASHPELYGTWVSDGGWTNGLTLNSDGTFTDGYGDSGEWRVAGGNVLMIAYEGLPTQRIRFNLDGGNLIVGEGPDEVTLTR